MYPRREFFDGPKRQTVVWVMRKGTRAVVCELWSHELGFELRLISEGDPMVRTQVCRAADELVRYQESWRLALEEQGWTPIAASP